MGVAFLHGDGLPQPAPNPSPLEKWVIFPKGSQDLGRPLPIPQQKVDVGALRSVMATAEMMDPGL